MSSLSAEQAGWKDLKLLLLKLKMAFNNTYSGKKVFVTGSTGFKGSWLCLWLQSLGATVKGYALEPEKELDNFVVCGLGKEIEQVYGDVRDAKKLEEAITSFSPDMVFHLAAQPIVLRSYDDPMFTFETNVIGTGNLLQAVRKTTSVKAVVVITSDKCYENKEQEAGYKEGDELGGKDPYSASKACAEILTRSFKLSFFNQENSPAIGTTRAGNVIGGGDWSDSRIIADIFRAVKDKTTLSIRNPKATRPWEHVLEPLSGYLLLGQKLLESKQYEGPWNFGPNYTQHYSVQAVVDEIIKDGTDLHVQYPELEDQPHEANLLMLDITKAKTELDWLPALNFEEMIKYTVEGYLDQIEGSKNLKEARIKQIEAYTTLAKTKNISWAS